MSVFMIGNLTGCAFGKAQEKKQPLAAEHGEERTWTDSLGRTLKLSAEIKRVAVSGTMSQIFVFALAPDLLVGLADRFGADAGQLLPEKYLKLPVLGQLYGGKGEISREELLTVRPDVVIDIGEDKPSAAQELDDLTKQTGIPFVHISMTTGSAGEVFRTLGELLCMKEEAERYAACCDSAFQTMQSVMEKVGENGKERLLYVTGTEGLNVIAKGSYHAGIIDLIADNVAVVDAPSAKGTGNEVDMEQILLWDPDYIVLAPNSMVTGLSEKKEWENVSAVKKGLVYKTPASPYNWMGFPPSAQTALGMLWLMKLLYPQYADYDMKEKVTEFYKLFFHCDLTDAQYAELMKEAL